MDVTGWSLEQRMMLPDHCFGNRQLIGTFNLVIGVGVKGWEISAIALPDPCCIWQLQIDSMPAPDAYGVLRFGLAKDVPASPEDMDAADEIFPYYGKPHVGPNQVYLYTRQGMQIIIPARKGMVTGDKKLVTELHSTTGTNRVDCRLLVSGLPTLISAW